MRYKLEIGEGGWLRLEQVQDGPLPVRAEGFLVLDGKKSPHSEMFLEVRGENVIVWVKGEKGGP